MVSPCNPHQRRQVAGQSAWPDLPPELLETIIGRLAPLDRVAVRLVCSPWRACARAASTPADLPFEAPRLLLRRPGPGGSLAFFSLHRREILPFALPDRLNAGGRCCGQIGSWLAMAFDKERAIALCNLFSGKSVVVPRAPVFPVAKIVLSSPPTSRGWVAAVLGRSGTIALLQPDVSCRWITIDAGAEHGGFRDMAFWRGRLCALGDDGAVLAYRADLRARVAAVSELREKQRGHGQVAWQRLYLYLVECEGELLVVRKLYSVRHDAAGLQVEVLLFLSEECKWEAVDELPAGVALFVGAVASVAVAAVSGVRENCVYLAQRNVDLMVPHAIGVYALGDLDTTVVDIAGGHSADVEPVWIIPSLV